VHDSRMFDKLVDESDEVGKSSKEPSDMVDRRVNEVQSDHMKADDRGIERTSGSFRAYM
jgi:hypothetical protein